jgi:hypothetical protein
MLVTPDAALYTFINQGALTVDSINDSEEMKAMDVEFEDTKRVIRFRKSKKDTQHNGKKYRRTNQDLQNITRKTKDRITRTQLNTGFELGCSGRVSKSCSTSEPWY